MIRHKEQRVGVFVDVANMYHSAKNLYDNSRVNFGEILKVAVGERKVIRAIAYVIKSQSVEEAGFFDALNKQGFEVKSKELQVFAGGAKKGDWDVEISMDAIKLAQKLDCIVLVSGDGDYVPLVKYLQENTGCIVEVIAFGETTSQKLKEVADDFIDLSKDTARYLISDRKSSLRKQLVAGKPINRKRIIKRRLLF